MSYWLLVAIVISDRCACAVGEEGGGVGALVGEKKPLLFWGTWVRVGMGNTNVERPYELVGGRLLPVCTQQQLSSCVWRCERDCRAHSAQVGVALAAKVKLLRHVIQLHKRRVARPGLRNGAVWQGYGCLAAVCEERV